MAIKLRLVICMYTDLDKAKPNVLGSKMFMLR